MTGGRTFWWAKDSGWWRREWIVELGEEFGADGPAVIDWLACEAKAQNDGGFVKAGRRTLARGSFVDLVTVGHILSRSVTLGLLEDFSEREGRFTCRISGWRGDQERAQAATRKAAQRANTEDSPPKSRSVPECPPTVQDSTGQVTASREARAEQLPSDFPDSLRPHLDAVLPVLTDVAERHNAKAVTRYQVAMTIKARGRKPLVRAAHDCAAHWDRKGQPLRDVNAAYRNWLDRCDDLAATEPLNGGAPRVTAMPTGRRPNAGDLIRQLREAEEQTA